MTAAASITGLQSPAGAAADVFVLYTFGDSILDCGRYNELGLHPGLLLWRNDDEAFPGFKGQDLQSRTPSRLEHRAIDGSTVQGLFAQGSGVRPSRRAVALLTVGGNDLLTGLAGDTGGGMKAFETALARFLRQLPVRPVLLATVYDPTFGHDERNFLGVEARVARANHKRVNDIIAAAASRHGELVDLHSHFLHGDPSWFTHTIEPSLRGASEVRRAFLPAVLAAGVR